MSQFTCEVIRVKIEPHPNADAIEIARVGDYQSIVKKGQFADGDLAVYIPEQAVLPEWLLKELGFWDDFKGKGMLSGAAGNRVRAIKLRGIVSQGLLLGSSSNNPGKEEAENMGLNGVELNGQWFPTAVYVSRSVTDEELDGPLESRPDGTRLMEEGADAAEFLGIKKYEPVIPQHMAGRVVGFAWEATHAYDFDNIKKFPDDIQEGDEVVITEKIHGTNIQIGLVPTSMANEKFHRGRVIVSSKGQGAKGFPLDTTDDSNLYVTAAKKYGLLDKILDFYGEAVDAQEKPMFLIGEVYGKTPGGAAVQQGFDYGQHELTLALFDVCMGNRGREEYAPALFFEGICADLGVPTVPVLYRGPFSKAKMLELTDGKETISGRGVHIREGVVVKCANEIPSHKTKRRIFKSVSSAYLLRKGGDCDEFQ